MLFICFLYFVFLDMYIFFFLFKQKTAYEMRISDWSSDVCTSDLIHRAPCRRGSPCRLFALSGDAGAIRDNPGKPWCADTCRAPRAPRWKIGRASCRERVCKYV